MQQKIKSFIQNVHHFRDAGLNQDGPPSDRVVIFDEAQRAWNREMTADFMRREGSPRVHAVRTGVPTVVSGSSQ